MDKQTEQTTPQINNYSDSVTNVVSIGDITLRSPSETIKGLINQATNLLKDKDVREYLEIVKRIKFSSTAYG